MVDDAGFHRCLCICARIQRRRIQKDIFPTDTDVFQELERDQAYKERFEAAAVLESRQRWERYSDELVDARKGSDIQLTVLRR